MKVADLKEYVEAHFTSRFVVNEFHATTPDNCCVVILGSSGGSNRNVVNLEFQFLVRNVDPEQAENLAHEIFNHFNNKSEYFIGNSRIVLSKGQNAIPLYTGKDENNRTIYSINIDVIVDK